ncbi:MAG: radical SAM protein [Candidatus Falkowbacteria bacterium]
MSKILLISTSFEDVSLVTAGFNKKEGAKTSDEGSHYPLGLAYLHSYLEKSSHEVKSLFLNNHNYSFCFEKTLGAIKSHKPDFVGLQILTPNRLSSFKIIEYIHQNYPEIKILIGGIHTTVLFEKILKKYPYIIAVLGEGEITASELIDELNKEKPILNTVAGIAFADEHKIIKTSDRKLIENLDELPFPRHEAFITQKNVTASLITTRGCPFNCSFCCLDKISQRQVRKRSIANIIAEIEYIGQKFPNIKSIWIHDDTFFVENQRVIDFCDEIIKRKIKFNFTCSGRMKPLSAELVKKLEKANFTKVLLGLESGNNEILKKCHKGITQEDAINAFKLFANSKIGVLAFLIVGLPGETLKTIRETGRFVQKLQKIKYVYYPEDIAILTVYPGTEIYEIAKAGGTINDDFWLIDQPTPLFTLENTQKLLFSYKETLLNYISLNKIFTIRGFIAQLPMIPFIIRYLLKSPSVLKILLIKFLKRILPNNIYLFLKNFIKR